MINRIFDLIVCFMLFPIIIFILFVVFVLYKYYRCNGSFIYKTKRIGINNNIFIMYKIRTMNPDTPEVATHLVQNPSLYISKFQSILRKYSIDELPQFINVVIGDLSIVGPRPALFNQYDLINLRASKNIHLIKPGITGLAQILYRDSISISNKVKIDYIYLMNKNLCFDLTIILKTLFGNFNSKNVSH